jgi:hypothetical protein
MPRTCLACAHSDRTAIDNALVAGEPLRNIAKRVSISPAGLLRHKSHVSQAIVNASERREEQLGDNLLDEMRRVQRKAWQLLDTAESEGDHRGAIVALREVRECLESLGAMLARVDLSGNLTLSQRLAKAKERLTGEQVLEARKRAGLGAVEHTIRFGDGHSDER